MYTQQRDGVGMAANSGWVAYALGGGWKEGRKDESVFISCVLVGGKGRRKMGWTGQRL